MASPETTELLSFRRTFTLLLLLVVLPSAGLSGFGVVAIVNERAAVEKHMEALWSGRLSTLELELARALETGQVESVDPLRVTVGGRLVTGSPFSIAGGAVACADARLRGALSALAPWISNLAARPVAFSVSSGQSSFLVVAMRHGEVVQGAEVEPAAVHALLAHLGAQVMGGDGAHYALVPVKREVEEGVMARLVSGVSEAGEAALGPPELSATTLKPPLQDFRLVASAVGEDPIAAASTRNRVLYAVLLALFYATLALGVVFTGRTLYREARLSRLKTDFVSLVSHELRTPLTSVRMFIETLALGRVKDPQEMQAVLDMLSRETTRLSAMIENVLDWARIESGRREYRRARVPVRDVVAAAADAFRAQRVGAAMTFTVDVPEDLPALEVDKDALAGALLNLLQNAFKYTGEDKRIALTARREGGHVAIEVKDNGAGIDRKDQKRIFERFFRVDSLLTRATEGTGLGLSIAQRIVQAHGGRITIDSAVGKGSTFRVHLPAHSA